MKKNLILLMAIIMAVMSLPSCSEDNPAESSSDITDYFPMLLDSWWKYENHVLDSATGQPIGDAEYDSMAVTNNAAEKLSKTVTEFTTWDLVDGNAQAPVMDYFYMEGDKLYAFSDLIARQLDLGSSLPIPISIDEMWVKIADPGASSWQIFQQPLKDIPIDIGVQVSLNGTFTISGNKKEISTTEIAGNDVKTQRYEILFVIKGVVDTGILGNKDLTVEARYSVWFAEGIGIVKTELKPFKAVIQGLYEFPFEGAQSVLTDHYVPTQLPD